MKKRDRIKQDGNRRGWDPEALVPGALWALSVVTVWDTAPLVDPEG